MQMVPNRSALPTITGSLVPAVKAGLVLQVGAGSGWQWPDVSSQIRQI